MQGLDYAHVAMVGNMCMQDHGNVFLGDDDAMASTGWPLRGNGEATPMMLW